MLLVKTDDGKEALRCRDPQLSPRERQIIILANGKHSRASIRQLMDKDIDVEIERLIRCGYIAERRPVFPEKSHTTRSGVATSMSESATEPEKSRQPQQQPSSRRSLAGTKMYIMDMLQLLRDMDASAMAVSIHTSQGEMDFIYHVIIATRLIAQKNGSSYGLRVISKLREIVPETHIAAIDALAVEIDADGVTQ